MKHLSLTIFLSLLVLTSFGQRSSGIVISQGVTRVTPDPNNLVWVDSTATGLYNWKLAKKDSLEWKPWNITWLNDSVISIGDTRYTRLSGSYTDPSFIQSLSSSKVFGLSPVALSGSYSDLSGSPNMSLYYLSSNPNGYISGITGPMVEAALGYEPYDASNPNNYITLSSLNTKQNYSDTSTWDVTMTTLEQQRFLKNLDTFNLSNFANDVGYITGITYGDVIGALGVEPIVQEVDGDTLNEIQNLTKTGNNISLSKGGGTVSINDSDSSNTNELQTLSIVNRIITLSNAGGTVTIPYQSYDSLTNKPTIPTNTNQLTNGSGFITQAQARTAISLTTTGSGAATYNNSTGVLNIPTSTTKRIETYSGNTNASGEYIVTFGTAFSTAPNIQASITNQTNSQQFIMVSAVSTTGCTIKVVQRNASFLSLLGLDVLTTGVTNVNNAPVDVLVTSK